MKDFQYTKFIFSLIMGCIIVFALVKLLGISIIDALMISGAITIIYSFTFIHTLLGQNASRSGSIFNQYEKVSRDMNYNIREEKGYILETLLTGIIEVLLSIIMMILG